MFKEGLFSRQKGGLEGGSSHRLQTGSMKDKSAFSQALKLYKAQKEQFRNAEANLFSLFKCTKKSSKRRSLHRKLTTKTVDIRRSF